MISSVLHLDRDPAVRDVATRIVADADGGEVDVTGVADPEAALRALDGGDVDCLVTDESAGPDGRPLAVVAREAHPDLSIVLFTDAPWGAVADLADRVGAAGYVRRSDPAAYEVLGERLARLADGVDEDLSAVDEPTAPLTTVVATTGVSSLGFDDDWQVVRSHDWGSEELVVAVADAVASVAGVPVDDLEPLYEVVDGEVLEDLLVSTDADVRVTFAYGRVEFGVDSGGTIAVRA